MTRKTFFLQNLLLCLLFSVSVFAQYDSTETKPQKNRRPFKDKIYFGGNLGLQFGNQTYIDVSPLVGYKFNDKFSAGIGVTYIYFKQHFPQYSQYDYETSIYGGRVFSRYFFIENLFAHAEVEVLNMEVFDVIKSDYERKNILSPLIGVGYIQRFGNAGGIYILLLYNINDTPDSPYSNPVVRIGVNIGL